MSLAARTTSTPTCRGPAVLACRVRYTVKLNRPPRATATMPISRSLVRFMGAPHQEITKSNGRQARLEEIAVHTNSLLSGSEDKHLFVQYFRIIDANDIRPPRPRVKPIGSIWRPRRALAWLTDRSRAPCR